MPPLKKVKGRYEIKAVLGEGGMGVVYRAYDPPPMNRDVALKTLLEFSDRTSLQLFYKECEVLKSMSHPNIVEIFDIGEFEDNGIRKPFFVMPLLPGQSLDVLIRNSSHRLTVERVVDIITQTCRGLQAAHERGLVHRDLKPSNLFVMQDDSVKIIDFGVAHNVDARSRSTGFQKGTLLYMAPEQMQFKPVSPQSDIFSLGIVCYEALTRRQPFRGATEEEVVNAILKYIPPPASEINPAVSPVISRVIHKAMAKQPWNRFDSAKEFGETLQKALRNVPIELFDPARIQPRIQRAAKALENGDYQFAAEIVSELEAEGNIDPQLTLLRTQVDQVIRQRTIAQLLEGARARFEEEEDPLALQKIQEVLQLDPNNVAALSLKSKIEERRSEKQIEKWLRLARQHVDNHAYSHAREALQNVTQMWSTEPRALRMLAEIEADEKDYLRIRQQKAQAYQSALNAWKNGEISEALSRMDLVLELDRRAPDTSSPETSATYQNFYNKVRSDYDAINNAYAQAQKALAERDCPGALKICKEYLAKYPNHALFQAFQVEVQEQQRQQLSAFIAEIDRKLDAERDLDAKMSLLRDALAQYPGEAHFERALRIVSDKRDLVNSILLRARAHEADSQFTEAIGDMEILRTIYAPYPGLQFEIERLQKRREQQARDAAKAGWVEQIDRQLETGNYPRALELLQKAKTEFTNDPELVELEKLATQNSERATQAEELLSRGLKLCQEGQFEPGIAALREGYKLDNRNPGIRAALRDNLIESARLLLDSDWKTAEPLISDALGIDPNHALARSLQIQIQDRKRNDSIAECASQARRLQSEGRLEEAAVAVERAMASYPAEPRLTVVRDTLNKELAQADRQRSRVRDLEEARGLQKQMVAAATDELPSIYEKSRVYVQRHPEDPELQSIAREIERVVRERGGDRKPNVRENEPDREQKSSLLAKLKAFPAWFLASGARKWTAAGVLVLLLGGLVWKLTPPANPGSSGSATIQARISTSPAGATIRINGESRGTSDLHLDLLPGEYQIEAELAGYTTAKQSLIVKSGASPRIDLVLSPLPAQIRISAPNLGGGTVLLDGNQVGTLESGSLTLPGIEAGDHTLRIVGVQNSEDATLQFHTAAGKAPVVDSGMQVHQLLLVAVTSGLGAAQVKSTMAGAPVMLDNQPTGQLGADGVQIANLSPGTHDLAIGQGSSLHRMPFESGIAPALDAIVYSDRDIGSVLVKAGEDDVTVFVDGRPFRRHTQNGQVAIPNLAIGQHTIRVRKEGFRDAADQTVAIEKGQVLPLVFKLESLPKFATLVMDALPPNTQVSLDGTIIGSVGADGNFSHENVSPGDHYVSVAAQGYPPKRIERHFSAGETVRISKDDIDLRRADGVLEIIAPTGVSYSIEQDGRVLRQLAGNQMLRLEEGEYRVVPSGGRPVNVNVEQGQVNHIRLSATISGSGMDCFPGSQWSKQEQMYVHRGGLALCNVPSELGTYQFTVKLHFSHPVFSHPSRIRWVVGFVDDKNYTKMEMDDKFMYRTDIINGEEHKFLRQPHHISADTTWLIVSVDVHPNTVLQSYTLGNDRWQPLYEWESSNAPSLNGRRTFNEGKFGFIAAGGHDIEIANFRYSSSR